VSASEDQVDVERVLAGDISAFEGIVRRWEGPIINLAYRFFRDRGRAEELAQEAFLRAFRGLAKWRKEAAFSTWLFALATNLCRSEFRRLPPRIVPLDDIPEPSDARPQDGGLADEDRDRTVRDAVFALPAKYRDVLVLFYFHDMDISAAAQSLGLPDGTIKARLSRGRELLRRKLEPRFASPLLKESMHESQRP